MLCFTVSNMACGGCAKGVARAIQSVDPNARIQTDAAEREVRVAGTADEATLLKALEAAGYPAKRKLG